MVLNIALLVVALAGVVKGADWFLKLVEIVGKRFGWPAFVIGVVLVGFGTSLPELATSISSVINGNDNVTIANIIGSNMANILLILGISTFFLGTITFKKDLMNLDLPYLFCASLLFGLLIIDGNLSFYDGLILLFCFVLYLLYNLTERLPDNKQRGVLQTVKAFFSNGGGRQNKSAAQAYKGNFAHVVLGVFGSIVLLALSSRVAIANMLEIAQTIDVGVEIITFVTIALGTSLPELLVTFKALRQKKGDLVLGNIIGSSIFNVLLVGGLVSVLSPQVIDAGVLAWSIVGLMIATLVAVLNGITKEIPVWQGGIFILIYATLISKLFAAG